MKVAKNRALAFKLIAFILAGTAIIFGAAFYYGHLDPLARYFAPPYCYHEPDGRHRVIFLGGEQYDDFTREW